MAVCRFERYADAKLRKNFGFIGGMAQKVTNGFSISSEVFAHRGIEMLYQELHREPQHRV